jgi:hypothetical protein
VVYALQVEQLQALELAYISAGADLEPGVLLDRFDAWLAEEPATVDSETTQLKAALGVAS